MSIILNIDTSASKAFICISKDGICLESISNEHQKDHAAFLHKAIQDALNSLSINIHTIDAIAVNAGPGSYTGLRVGLASGKGLCFTLNKPLITVNSLEILAAAVVEEIQEDRELLICPMIDARRMEVFTALYNNKLEQIEKPHALVLNNSSFSHSLDKQPVIFCGDGAEKFLNLVSHPNASMLKATSLEKVLSKVAHHYYQKNIFANLAYSEPFYLKDFYDNR